jgi:hypothetical protein
MTTTDSHYYLGKTHKNILLHSYTTPYTNTTSILANKQKTLLFIFFNNIKHFDIISGGILAQQKNIYIQLYNSRHSFSFIKRPYVALLALDYFFLGGRFGLNYAEKSIS